MDNKRNCDVSILVASHKENSIDLPDCYKVIQVNADKAEAAGNLWPDTLHDHDGFNISRKNNSYCELTALYWGWRNSDAAIKGLVHYRRVFSYVDRIQIRPVIYTDPKNFASLALDEDQMARDLQSHDIILTMPYSPWPRTAREDLELFCYPADIDKMTQVIQEEYPEYLNTYNQVMECKTLSYCNMMIAGSKVYDEYCAWLFPLLDKIEQKIDISGYDAPHQRIYGYLAEVLLNVWVRHHRLTAKYYVMAADRGILKSYDKPSRNAKSVVKDKLLIAEDALYRLPGFRSIIKKCKTPGYRRMMDCSSEMQSK